MVHDIRMQLDGGGPGRDLVVKRYVHRVDEGPQHREWRALTLLAEHAPGLAPEPVAADPEGRPPSVTMTRIAGRPLRGGVVTKVQTRALAHCVRRLQGALAGPAALDRLPLRPWHAAAAVAGLKEWAERGLAEGVPREVRTAWTAGLRWLETLRLPDPASDGAFGAAGAAGAAVFGHGDGNLANYLWDEASGLVRVLDFEDSGRSDRLYELAEITEHVSAWQGTEFDVGYFLECCEVEGREAQRLLTEYRRLVALIWTYLLSTDPPANPPNPPGTGVRQAERMLALLG